MIAVIMAGGRGQRLLPYTRSVPKPMLKVQGIPIVELVVRKLAAEGFTDIIITTGYRGRMIKEHLGDGSDFGVRIDYTTERRPLGTIGGLTQIERAIDQPFLVFNGDVLTDQDIGAMMRFHNRRDALLTVGVVDYRHNFPYSVVESERDLFAKIVEKPETFMSIGAGIYVVSPEVLGRIEAGRPKDFPTLLTELETERGSIYCFPIRGLWMDIGRPQDYWLAQFKADLPARIMKIDKSDKTVMRVPLVRPEIGVAEAAAAYGVVQSGWLTQGEKVKEFERGVADYVGSPEAVAFFNGTVALHAALMGLNVGPGDEVIVPSLTFVSTASAVIMTGARPVFADVGPDHFNLDPADCARRITERTRAIIPVHYGGRPCDMDSLQELADGNDITLIEDAAEALGASYRDRMAGTLGRAAMFSFTPGKVITTGEGGILTTADKELADRLRLLRNHGMTAPYQYEIIGYNYRMTELQAAIGLEQLLRVEEVINARGEKAKLYSERLKDIPGLKIPDHGQDIRNSFSLYTIIVDRFRDDLAAFLAEKNVETKVYFPPVHRQKALKPHVDSGLSLPNTEHLADHILSLPIYPSLSVPEIDYVADLIKLFVHKRS